MLSLNCHCRDCQRLTGSAYSSYLGVSTASFRLTKGQPKYYVSRADSGHRKHTGFCPECGAPVYGRIEEIPDMLVLVAGSLDDPSWHQPQMDLFTSRAQPWDVMNPALQKREAGLPE